MSDILTIEYTAKEGYVKPDLVGGLEWIAALESGKYKQGTGLLKYKLNNRLDYCCLGVKCEIDGLFNDSENKLKARFNGDSSGTYLPIGHPWQKSFKESMEFPAGFKASVFLQKTSGGVKTIICCESLADMNDRGLSFKTIIMLIKAAWNPI